MPLRPGVSAELLEEDVPDLLGRAEHELLARELVRARLELLDHLAEPRGDLAHPVLVDLDAGLLHRGQHRRERQLDPAVERLHVALADPLEQEVAQPERGGGVADERSGLLLGRRIRLELQAVLRLELYERILGPGGLDQVREEQRVVDRLDALSLCVVDDHGPSHALGRRHDHALGVRHGDPLLVARDRHFPTPL